VDVAQKIQKVLSDQNSVSLTEAVQLAKVAESMGIHCEVVESPVWGDYTLNPR
jgi:dihydrodipicolinate synthase/N-acetylneuraminate lyase